MTLREAMIEAAVRSGDDRQTVESIFKMMIVLGAELPKGFYDPIPEGAEETMILLHMAKLNEAMARVLINPEAELKKTLDKLARHSQKN